MKRIPLTQGKFAIVDDADYEWLRQWKWRTVKHDKTYYAMRDIRLPNDKGTTLYMHRQILGLSKGDRSETDHIDGNGLDNRRCKIRICNRQQNASNRGKQKGTSKFRGVSWCQERRKWRAQIRINGKNKYLGCFDSEFEAAKAYDAAARKYFGEYARLNVYS